MCTTKYKNEDNTSINTNHTYIKSDRTIVSFVEFILNSRQFKLMTTGSRPHGARWPRFNCVENCRPYNSLLTYYWLESTQSGVFRNTRRPQNTVKCYELRSPSMTEPSFKQRNESKRDPNRLEAIITIHQ